MTGMSKRTEPLYNTKHKSGTQSLLESQHRTGKWKQHCGMGETWWSLFNSFPKASMLSSSHLCKVPRTYVCLFVPCFLPSFILTVKLPQKCCQLPLNYQLLVFSYVSTFTNALWYLIFKLFFPWLLRLDSLGYPSSRLTTPCGLLSLC